MMEDLTMNNEELITIVDDEGKETLFEIVMTFHLDAYEKDYVCAAPVDGEEDEEGLSDLFVFSFVPDESGESGNLEEVVDEAEWAACEEVIDEFLAAEELDGE